MTELSPRFRKLLTLGAGARTTVIDNHFVSISTDDVADSLRQTKDAFSAKWKRLAHGDSDFEASLKRQKAWYLELYGFGDERCLAQYLESCRVVLDAGAGNCGKAAWFADLSPSTTVVAADISDSLHDAARYYSGLENLFFIRCDIASMPIFRDGLFDYVSCDQAIHHTQEPHRTFRELVRLTGAGKDLSVYAYRKKALPRELLDDYFREFSKELSDDQLMELSEQLTEVGRLLSAIDHEIDFPAVPLLGIEGGKMTVQRFIYWNLIKCFWNEELGWKNSVLGNYDWYAPSQAFRYSEEEFRSWIRGAELDEVHFHRESACFSGRFRKPG